MMIPAGSSVRVMVQGSYGPFDGIGGPAAITAALNNAGFTVDNFSDNSPNLLSQIIDGDFVSRPYQITLDLETTQAAFSGAVLTAAVSAAVGKALSTLPNAVALVLVNGTPTGQTQAPSIYGLTGLADATLKPALDTVQTVLIVAVLGLVALVAFAPKSLRAVL